MQDLKPKFTALDWNKVPNVSPEEEGNTVSLAIRLSTVEGIQRSYNITLNVKQKTLAAYLMQ